MLIAVVHLPSISSSAARLACGKVPAGEPSCRDHPTQQPDNVPAVPANNTAKPMRALADRPG